MNGQAIGIDLGTYNSAAAFAADDGRVHMIRSHYGPTLQGTVFPSFLRFDAGGNVVARGEEARQDMAIAPDLVVWGVKRLIGRTFSQVEKEIRRFAYPIEAGPAGEVRIRIGERAAPGASALTFSPGDISERILRWIKQDAAMSAFLVGGASKAVVTHPAYFDTLQTEKTKDAARQAGFGEVELISEPEAAALAYGTQLDPAQRQFIMVLDWGAGTLDIAIVGLRLGREGRPVLSEVIPARGDVALGGLDMDDLLLARAVELYRLDSLAGLVRAPGRPATPEEKVLADPELPEHVRRLLKELLAPAALPEGRPEAPPDAWKDLCRLRTTIEKAKIALSGVPACSEFSTCQGRPLAVKMARSAADRLDGREDWILLEDVLGPCLETFRQNIRFTLAQSGLAPSDIHHVLLIGGPMHMPCVRRVVGEEFSANRAVVAELQALETKGFPVDPMEAVARGAALNARNLGPARGVALISRDYGVLLGQQGAILIKDGDSLPCQATMQAPLGCQGQPGDRVPVGLYKREIGPGKPPKGEFTRFGDYLYTPTFAKGRSQFCPTLEADRDGIVSLKIRDLLSPDETSLERLSSMPGQSIPEPSPIMAGAQGGAAPAAPELPTSDLVPEDKVTAARRAAQARLSVAGAKARHPRVQAEPQVLAELQKKVSALAAALAALPPSGPAGQKAFAQVGNRSEELRNFLETHGLLTAQERQMLFGAGA